jgi:hypothetical protein
MPGTKKLATPRHRFLLRRGAALILHLAPVEARYDEPSLPLNSSTWSREHHSTQPFGRPPAEHSSPGRWLSRASFWPPRRQAPQNHPRRDRALFRFAIVLCVPTPQLRLLTRSCLSESCAKIGDVPKSPVPILAAWSRRLATITSELKLRSRSEPIRVSVALLRNTLDDFEWPSRKC